MTTPSTVSDPENANADRHSDVQSENVCIFSHFDRDSVVRRYVFTYVEAILSAGFSVMFVSTANRISAEDRDRLAALGADVHIRENKGIDFGSWQYGISKIENKENIDRLLLANDSVFGPFFDLGLMLRQMKKSDADFWGVTESYDGNWHLQSYFLCFNRNVFQSAAFAEFFKKDFASLTKRQVIIHGEVGLSQALIRAGFKGAASCPYGALRVGKFNGPRNPTQHYWDELIEDCRCPFLKTLLLRENPNGVSNIDRWRDVLARSTTYDITLIEDYLTAFGEATPKGSTIRLVFSKLRQLPYALQLLVRAAARAVTHQGRTVWALEQYVATDPSLLPPHPGPRPTVAYADLDASDVATNSGVVDPARKRRTADG